jgi:poly-gamma-glutamate synthesis protein (capsule biosynthesis protein)
MIRSKNDPIQKAGPTLGVPSECINGLKGAEIDVINLANNHIMDHGPEGLYNTLKVCEKAGILTVGAGKNLDESRKFLIKEIDNIRIAIASVTEHEFSIASEESFGANPLDLINYVFDVKKNRESFDYLIVLFHGGNEYYPYPSPRLKTTCRFMIDQGANLVVVQHTHCPGCFEKYKGSHIVYGQGDLIFDYPKKNKNFYEGFLVKVSINKNVKSEIDIIPYLQSYNFNGAKKMQSKNKKKFLNKIQRRSVLISDDTFLEKIWIEFCKNRNKEYLNRIFGYNYILKKLIKVNLFKKYFFSKKSILRFQNTIFCESHREVLETLLNKNML